MKKVIVTMIALWAVTELAFHCLAEPPQDQEPDPTQFMDLLDESSAAPGGDREVPANESAPKSSAVPAGGQVQRLLEESELILRGIAADAAPLRDELQKGYASALDVIRAYIERLPKKAASPPTVAECPPPQRETPFSREDKRPADTDALTQTDAEPGGIQQEDIPTRILPTEAPPAPPAAAVADSPARVHADNALLKAASKLRETAAVAAERAEELERMSKSLEGTPHE